MKQTIERKLKNSNRHVSYNIATKKNVHVNVAALKQYQMCIMIFAFFVRLEHIKNINKKIMVDEKFPTNKFGSLLHSDIDFHTQKVNPFYRQSVKMKILLR